jgi:hypothetical protein
MDSDRVMDAPRRDSGEPDAGQARSRASRASGCNVRTPAAVGGFSGLAPACLRAPAQTARRASAQASTLRADEEIDMSRMRRIVLALAAAAAPALSCGGSGGKQASEPGASSQAGDLEDRETECCCQRYDEDGNPTGATVSDTTACKSTGGTCTEDQSQCEEE